MSAALHEICVEEDEGEPVELEIPGFHEFRLLVDGLPTQVYKAKTDGTNEPVAIKIVHIEDNVLTSHVIRELLQNDLKHENVVTLKSVHLLESRLCLIMEYMPVDLEGCMLVEVHPKSYLEQILKGLSYLHSHGVLHRDLKPENIMVDNIQEPHIVKIADFGLSRAFLSPNAPLSPHVGACGYMAPEIVLGSQLYSYPADVWAVGCIFANMVRSAHMIDAKPLFSGSSRQEELIEIFRVFDIPTEDTWPGVSSLPTYQALISIPGLVDQPPTGLSAHVPGLDHCGLDLLKKMLCLCPDNRITAEAALEHEYFSTS